MRSLAILCALTALAVGCASPEKKYSGKSDAELKLRHTQLVEEIAQPRGWNSDHFGGSTESRKGETKERERIEVELLRRYQAGDQAAYLPQFSR